MGEVIPFILRARELPGWTPAERALLERLADQFDAAGIGVEVVYGATDDGDPWCAVKDGAEEVLVHVARIGGRFVVHSTADDSLSEGADLPTLLRERLKLAAAAVEKAEGVVLPFELRQAQLLLALMIATAFFWETVAPSEAHAATLVGQPTSHDDTPAAIPDVHLRREAFGPVIHGPALPAEAAVAAVVAIALAETAVASESAPAAAQFELPQTVPLSAWTAPAPTPAPVPAAEAQAPPPEIHGTGGDDYLVGTATAEVIVGGAGDDTISGGGGADTLDGGAGDDTLELSAETTAIGGSGADTFVLLEPGRLGDGEAFLGRILDFRAEDGDRIVTWRGRTVPTDGLTPPPNGEFHPAGFTGVAAAAGAFTRLSVDLDGDGRPDGYVLVGQGHPPPEAPPEARGVMVIGHPPPWMDGPGG